MNKVPNIIKALLYPPKCVLRLSLIPGYRQKKRDNEPKCYRRTARLLFLLNILMGAAVWGTVILIAIYMLLHGRKNES